MALVRRPRWCDVRAGVPPDLSLIFSQPLTLDGFILQEDFCDPKHNVHRLLVVCWM